MNYCDDGHDPIYKIKYNPVSFGGYASEWLVCEKCFGRQEFFGAAEEIESITSLKNYEHIGLTLDHLSVMTRTLTKKLKNVLLIN